MTDEQLIAELGTAHVAIAGAINAVDRVRQALDLPFRPACFDQLGNVYRSNADMLSAAQRIIAERDQARAELAKINAD